MIQSLAYLKQKKYLENLVLGKRSSGFERIEKDFYATIDPRAGQMMLKVLDDLNIENATFYEPCYGNGDLIENLKSANPLRFTNTGYSDIQMGKDALSLTKDDLGGADYIITNPPWSRPLLHDMILHFKDLAPTFLLFDSDWSNNKAATPFLPYCRCIYPIGRLRWIPDTKLQSKDNCAWYLFTKSDNIPTEFKNLR